MTWDTYHAAGLLGLATLVAFAYVVRVGWKGPVHFERIERHGTTPLLGKALLEMGYWGIQPLARLLTQLQVSATAISWVSLFFGVLAGISLAFGYLGSGGMFAAVAGILDALDGMIARMTGTSSQSGKVLDSTLDRYVEFFFIAGLAIYYRPIFLLQIVALFALLGSFMVSYSTAIGEIFGIEIKGGAMRRVDRMVYLIGGAILSPVTIPWLESSRQYPVPVGHPMAIALCLVAVLSNPSAVGRIQKIRMVLGEKKLKR